MKNQQSLILFVLGFAFVPLSVFCSETKIDRKQLVERHNPVITAINPEAPFTIGNGHFAFTADVTGLQSITTLYYEKGIPLETKARWAWHTRSNKNNYTLHDANIGYDAYGRKVNFPTNMESEAGQWLRKNPHDLPLARIGLLLDSKEISTTQIANINQKLDLWRGALMSHYTLQGKAVSVITLAHNQRDIVAASVESTLIDSGRLSISLDFPRGYDLGVKNTPKIDWLSDNEHTTILTESTKRSAVFSRKVDDEQHLVRLSWQGSAKLIKTGKHSYQLQSIKIKTGKKDIRNSSLEFSVEFLQPTKNKVENLLFEQVKASAESGWKKYWLNGAVIDFTGSRDPRAHELERRIVLSQYLMGVQSRADTPTQETGLTSSSWYGKHHTEMAWWHSAHWILWDRSENAERVLAWYIDKIDSAREVAKSRGLKGARWAKMVGPEGRESPGGNPLIIWNQPQVIHLAELVYKNQLSRANPNKEVLLRYARLVEETAESLSSMLVWDQRKNRYSLEPPIWIAQEIYDPAITHNPAFELSYWRYGLKTAQLWRKRLGKKENPVWHKQITRLADLPQADGKYVAIESVPDTFSNIKSRQDHPTMLAPLGLLNDETVDSAVMRRTLHAVLDTWDWKEKIWGWDYPMIAMTAMRLGEPEIALDILLKNAPHNRYLPNGHCPQEGANLPVYLPANGALLAAVAMLVNQWEIDSKTDNWKIRSEGFKPLM